MTKNEIRLYTYIKMRLRDLALCNPKANPYNIAAVDARISELKELLKMFKGEDQCSTAAKKLRYCAKQVIPEWPKYPVGHPGKE